MSPNTTLLHALSRLREQKGLTPLNGLDPKADLRTDLGLDSLDLAEMTVILESQTGVDVFKEGVVRSVGEVLERLR